MATRIVDVLKVDLAFAGIMLLRDFDEVESFRRSIDADAVVNDKGPLSFSKRILLGRERIILESDITPSFQTTLSREYPTFDGLGRLAEVARCAIVETNLSDQQLQGYICRIDLIYDQDSGLPAATYLANRLFAPNLQCYEGWDLREGSCRMIFAEGENQWAIFVEPRFGNEETNTVYLSVARRMDEQSIPEQSQIEETLREVWIKSQDFINRLDEEIGSA